MIFSKSNLGRGSRRTTTIGSRSSPESCSLHGGGALGGGIANANTTATGALITTDPYPVLTLLGTDVTKNQANGGTAGAGGTVGLGVGGGLYNQVGAVAFADKHTKIKKKCIDRDALVVDPRLGLDPPGRGVLDGRRDLRARRD